MIYIWDFNKPLEMFDFTYLGSNIGYIQRYIRSECIQNHKPSHKTHMCDYTTYYKAFIPEVNSFFFRLNCG